MQRYAPDRSLSETPATAHTARHLQMQPEPAMGWRSRSTAWRAAALGRAGGFYAAMPFAAAAILTLLALLLPHPVVQDTLLRDYLLRPIALGLVFACAHPVWIALWLANHIVGHPADVLSGDHRRAWMLVFVLALGSYDALLLMWSARRMRAAAWAEAWVLYGLAVLYVIFGGLVGYATVNGLL